MRLMSPLYIVSFTDGDIIALMPSTNIVNAVVASVSQECPVLCVDALNFDGDGKHASWRVEASTDLGEPVFHRRSYEEAAARAEVFKSKLAIGLEFGEEVTFVPVKRAEQ